MKEDRCNLCRPGGFVITDRAIRFCNFKKNSKLADIGCGLGATVRYVKENYKLDICGVDKDENSLCQAINYGKDDVFLLTDGSHLPFDDGIIDGLLFECSLSKMDNYDLILNECSRVLEADGYLVISDLYARGKPAQLSGLLGRVDTKETFLKILAQYNFKVKLFEDYSSSLLELWGQMIFEHGANELYDNIGTDIKSLKEIKCGYFLIVAQNNP